MKFEQHPLSNSRDNSNVNYNFISRGVDADGDVDASVTVIAQSNQSKSQAKIQEYTSGKETVCYLNKVKDNEPFF